MKNALHVLATTMTMCLASAHAAELNTTFSCSTTRTNEGEPVIYADSGRFWFDQTGIRELRWESAVHRPTHGFDCSIDASDNPVLQASPDEADGAWRIGLRDARIARLQRGFDFDRGLACAIDLSRQDRVLHIVPRCPALCGSRPNFTALSVHLDTGACDYH